MKCQLSRSASSYPNDALATCCGESNSRNLRAAANMALPLGSFEPRWARRIAPIVTVTTSGTANRIQRACMSLFLFRLNISPGRPAKMSSSQNVHVQMIDGLPGVGAAINDDPITLHQPH